ncbi:glycosyltransferase family 4 protein [Sphingobacterium sp. ML3W]|uniref:glycosyltransferase family 4 protein n=1 Tax=Sphingobacterium sp. ML3W TaxID=1538644 RepID=UPI000ABB67F5|nr:glycosyltransferase family 4 protein [Sphingobacterium sp. ML3W]
MKTKIVRITTVPISLNLLLKGQLRFMGDNGFDVVGVSSPGEELAEVRDREGIRIAAIKMSRKITPFADFKSLLQLFFFLKNERPYIVHTHTPKAGIIGMIAAKLAGVPIRLHTVAGMPLMEATGIKRKILDLVEKLTYDAATGVYPNSKGLYDFIIQNHYTSKEKLNVICNGSSNGIDTSFFSRENLDEDELVKLKTSLMINEHDFVFVFIGRLVSDKGINELVSAFVQLNKPHVKLLLVGSLESDLDPLDKEIQVEIDNNPSIITVGFQRDVRPYFAISNVLVFPSYREGFPNVVMQAGSLGLPSIVSNINGCNEIIIEGQNGTIIPLKNADVVLEAMIRFVDDVNFYNNLKSKARKMITDRYEQKVVWNSLLTEYNRLLQKKGLKHV